MHEELASVPTAILTITLLGDWLDRWMSRHTVSIQRHQIAIWKRWSFVEIRDGDELWLRGFYLTLPSYAWETDLYRQQLCWHQRVLMWDSKVGWRVELRAVYD